MDERQLNNVNERRTISNHVGVNIWLCHPPFAPTAIWQISGVAAMNSRRF
jgi:hypothetical protein